MEKTIDHHQKTFQVEGKLFEQKNKKKETRNKCAICLDMIGKNNSSTTKCGHTFCLTCLHENLKISHKCPCCRSKILSKKPKKPLAKLNKKNAIQMINRELRGWDGDLMIESYASFPGNARSVLRGDLQRFGLELVKQFMIFQINGDNDSDDEDMPELTYDEDSEEEDEEDDEEEEDEINHNNLIVDLIQETDDEEEEYQEDE